MVQAVRQQPARRIRRLLHRTEVPHGQDRHQLAVVHVRPRQGVAQRPQLTPAQVQRRQRLRPPPLVQDSRPAGQVLRRDAGEELHERLARPRQGTPGRGEPCQEQGLRVVGQPAHGRQGHGTVGRERAQLGLSQERSLHPGRLEVDSIRRMRREFANKRQPEVPRAGLPIHEAGKLQRQKRQLAGRGVEGRDRVRETVSRRGMLRLREGRRRVRSTLSLSLLF
mmetsp:Transcript_28823/g.64585  ORF Transcript_28823/g.64585 Transcript_28823/m.64585 type:complete len:223 (-) Transcript_28823:227-895(-)